VSKKPPPRAFVRPVFSLCTPPNHVDDEHQAIATSILAQSPRSHDAIRCQAPASLHSTMIVPVPHVIHSHEPEPLAQLAKQVQEPGTPQAATASPSPLPHLAPGKNKIIPSRNDNAANNCITMCLPIKNEVAQHSRNNIFSLLNIRQEIKNRNGGYKKTEVIHAGWVLSEITRK